MRAGAKIRRSAPSVRLHRVSRLEHVGAHSPTGGGRRPKSQGNRIKVNDDLGFDGDGEDYGDRPGVMSFTRTQAGKYKDEWATITALLEK